MGILHNSIGKSTLFITASKLVSLLMNMACVMILSRIRTLEEYGTYSQLLMSSSLISSLFILGLPNSINFFLARAESPEEKQNYLSRYYTLNFLLATLAGVILWVCIPLLEAYYRNPDISMYSYFLLFYPFSSITMSSVESVLLVYERPNTLIFYRLSNSLGQLSVLLLADRLALSFQQYLILFLAVELGFSLAVYGIVRHLAGGLRFSLRCGGLKEILSFSIPLGLASAVGTLSRELDKLVISGSFSPEEYAVFSNAAKELPLTVLAAATTMVVMPKIVLLLHRGRKEQAIDLWRDSFVVNFTVMSVFVFGIMAYAPEAMTILYSEKYLPGVTVFRIYTLLLLLRSTYFGMMLNAIGKTRIIFRNSLFILGLNLLLNLLFCRLFGFVGPALATVLVTFISAYQLCYQTAKELGVSIRILIPFRTITGITFVNIIFTVVFESLKQVLPFDQWAGKPGEAFLLGGLWVLVYAAVMYRFLRKKWRTINQTGEVH